MHRNRLSGLNSMELPFRAGLSSPSPVTPSDNISQPTARFLDTVGAINRAKKRKPGHSELPAALEKLFPDAELYSKLLEYERRVDSVIEARNIEIADALHHIERVKSVLRIYIWNESQMATDPSKDPQETFWKLKISGRLLPPKQKPGEVTPNIKEADKHQGLPFAYFLKSLEVEIDPQNLNGQSSRIKWNKANDGDEEKEVFEVLRPGAKALPLKISFVFDHQAPLFRLNERFSKLLGFEMGTRSKVITEMWNYIKTKNLQTNKDPSVITCDADLKALFGGAESIQLSNISGKLNELLLPADKVTLDYTLQLEGFTPALYDVELEFPATIQPKIPIPFLNRQSHDTEISRLDRILGETIQKILEHMRRRTFFMGFSESPIDFVNTLLKAQSKEASLFSLGCILDVVTGSID